VGTVPPETWAALEQGDADGAQALLVFVSAAGSELRESERGRIRTLDRGDLRHARLSPDGRRLVYQAWHDRSWDLRLLERTSGRSAWLTEDRANEVEPSWAEDGRSVLFASDRRRGLGSTALYRVAVP
jgi:Tol biopolymer transport system component